MVQPSFLADPEVLQHASLVDFTPPEDKHGSRSKTKRHSDRSNKDKDDTPAPAKAHTTAANTEHDARHAVPETAPTLANQHTVSETGVRPQDLMLAPGGTQQASSSRQQLDSIPDAHVSTSMPPPALKPSASRHAADKKKLKEKRTRFKAPGPRMPILSDARAECVLTAARKIGRVRAGIAAGLVRERERRESEAQIPAEGEPGPSNYAASAYPPMASPPQMRVGPASAHPPHPYAMPGFVYMQAVPSPPGGRAVPAQGAMMVPMWPMQGPGTPPAGRQPAVNQTQQAVGRGRGLGRGRAQGSLDSLLTAATAARTMMVGEEHGAGAGEETEKEDEEEDEEERPTGKARAAKRPQRRKSAAASAPKRRKTGASVSASASASTGGLASTARGGGTGRTRRPTKKALEALDQAQDRKGKGKQREAPPAPAHAKGKANGVHANARPAHVAPPPAPPPPAAPVARVRSALDVLAEQAAQEQEWMPVSGPGSPSRRQSAEPAVVRRARLGPGLAAVVRTQTVETVRTEEDELEEEEGEGEVECGSDADADAGGCLEEAHPGAKETHVARQETLQPDEPSVTLERTRHIAPGDIGAVAAAPVYTGA